MIKESTLWEIQDKLEQMLRKQELNCKSDKLDKNSETQIIFLVPPNYSSTLHVPDQIYVSLIGVTIMIGIKFKVLLCTLKKNKTACTVEEDNKLIKESIQGHVVV